MKFQLFLIGMFCNVSMAAGEYVYPITTCTILDQEFAFVMHQKDQRSTLWLWNSHTKQADALLSGSCMPCGLDVLHDQSGFSFIHCGRIRVKKFTKRSPKTLEFDDPIYAVNSLAWVDEQNGYCSAKRKERYGIFKVNIKNKLTTIAWEETSDCLYPCVTQSTLCYIKRIEAHKHTYQYQFVEHANTTIDLHDLHCGPIVLLHMISPQQGFFIEQIMGQTTSDIDIKNDTATFAIHLLNKVSSGWTAHVAVHCTLPTKLLVATSPERLLEPIVPLRPRFYHNMLYFVDAREGSTLNVYVYDLATGCIEQKTWAAPFSGHHFFVPCLVGSHLLCGYAVDKEHPGLVLNGMGEWSIRLLEIV